MRRLIVNADDLGMTKGINRAIVEGCEKGIITSSTLMATAGAFDDAVQHVRSLQSCDRHFSVGCHVVLLDGVPLLAPDTVASLLEAPGRSNGPQLCVNLSDFARLALSGKLKPDEIEAEADAQFGRIQTSGLELTHFDCHKHVHMFQKVLQPLLRAAKARGIRAVRNPFSRWPPLPTGQLLRTPKLWTRVATMGVLRTLSDGFRREVERHRFRTPDGSVGVLVTGVLDEGYLSCIAENLPEGTWEFVCHPGYNDADLDQVRTRLRQSRVTELELLTSPGAKAILQRHSIDLISYQDL